MEITDEGGTPLSVARVQLTPAEADQLRAFLEDLFTREGSSEIDLASNDPEFDLTFDARSEVLLAFRQANR